MTIRIIGEARLELLAGVEYYESEQAGLGKRCWDEVDEHLAWTARNPEVAKLRVLALRGIRLQPVELMRGDKKAEQLPA